MRLIDWRFRQEDEYNRSGFWFRFLNFEIWDMSTFEFGVEVELGVQGIRVAIALPFLRLRVTLLPDLDPSHRTWRRSRFPRGFTIDKMESRFILNQGDRVVGTFETKKAAIEFARLNEQ